MATKLRVALLFVFFCVCFVDLAPVPRSPVPADAEGETDIQEELKILQSALMAGSRQIRGRKIDAGNQPVKAVNAYRAELSPASPNVEDEDYYPWMQDAPSDVPITTTALTISSNNRSNTSGHRLP